MRSSALRAFAAPVAAPVVALVAALAGCGGSDPAPDAGPGASCTASWTAPTCAATDFAGKLACIPGLTAVARPDRPLAGYTRYDLTFLQPIDHARPELGTFTQRAMLLLASPERPMVLATSGYNLSSASRVDEVAALFGANELWYEHRFFLASTPGAPADWSKLDIEQAAGDAHRLAAALHWLFPGPWVNTGGSKGGMTSVFQRRFHPCDVDATVAYVAPVTVGALDPAYRDFVANVGGAARAGCRADLRAFQRRALAQRSEILPLVQGTFTQVSLAKAYEIAVVELSFTLWQYTSPDDASFGCAKIPPAGATPQEMLAFLEHHASPAAIASDESLALYRAYYDQSARQLGYPAPLEDGLSDLLQFPGADVPATYLPAGTAPSYDARALPDVTSWLAAEGTRVMFIYGELDPWTTRMFEPAAAHDVVRYIAPGANHGAKIRSLTTEDRAAATAKLEAWLGVRAQPSTAALRLLDEEIVERWPR